MSLVNRRTRGNRLYLNCPRCGLSMVPRADWMGIEHCPRCLARSRTLVELFASPLPPEELYEDGLAPCVAYPGDDREGSEPRGDGWTKPVR